MARRTYKPRRTTRSSKLTNAAKRIKKGDPRSRKRVYNMARSMKGKNAASQIRKTASYASRYCKGKGGVMLAKQLRKIAKSKARR